MSIHCKCPSTFGTGQNRNRNKSGCYAQVLLDFCSIVGEQQKPGSRLLAAPAQLRRYKVTSRDCMKIIIISVYTVLLQFQSLQVNITVLSYFFLIISFHMVFAFLFVTCVWFILVLFLQCASLVNQLDSRTCFLYNVECRFHQTWGHHSVVNATLKIYCLWSKN